MAGRVWIRIPALPLTNCLLGQHLGLLGPRTLRLCPQGHRCPLQGPQYPQEGRLLRGADSPAVFSTSAALLRLSRAQPQWGRRDGVWVWDRLSWSERPGRKTRNPPRRRAGLSWAGLLASGPASLLGLWLQQGPPVGATLVFLLELLGLVSVSGLEDGGAVMARTPGALSGSMTLTACEQGSFLSLGNTWSQHYSRHCVCISSNLLSLHKELGVQLLHCYHPHFTKGEPQELRRKAVHLGPHSGGRRELGLDPKAAWPRKHHLPTMYCLLGRQGVFYQLLETQIIETWQLDFKQIRVFVLFP